MLAREGVCYIEVQYDWAQRYSDEQQHAKEAQDAQVSNRRQINVKLSRLEDPLLPHYERLALKAAIDHARSEGADSIAISDAETAMMTEGHDRQRHPTKPTGVLIDEQDERYTRELFLAKEEVVNVWC